MNTARNKVEEEPDEKHNIHLKYKKTFIKAARNNWKIKCDCERGTHKKMNVNCLGENLNVDVFSDVNYLRKIFATVHDDNLCQALHIPSPVLVTVAHFQSQLN